MSESERVSERVSVVVEGGGVAFGGFLPLGGGVLVRFVEREGVSSGGIVLPDVVEGGLCRGVVVGLGGGPVRGGVVVGFGFGVGDVVLFGGGVALGLVLGGVGFGLLRFGDVLGVFRQEGEGGAGVGV